MLAMTRRMHVLPNTSAIGATVRRSPLPTSREQACARSVLRKLRRMIECGRNTLALACAQRKDKYREAGGGYPPTAMEVLGGGSEQAADRTGRAGRRGA